MVTIRGAFGLIAMLTAATLGPWAPWSSSNGDAPSAAVGDETAEVDLDGQDSEPTEPEMPPHLVVRTPEHLDQETGVVPAESTPTSAGTSRVSTPVATTTSTPAAEPAPTTSVPPSTTTTTTPETTPTLPEKKDDPEPSMAATNDTYSIEPESIVHLTVLDNDSSSDGALDPATLSLVSGPSHAARFTLADGYFRYRSYPVNGGKFSTEDSFVYEVCDDTGLCDTATVSVLVSTN